MCNEPPLDRTRKLGVEHIQWLDLWVFRCNIAHVKATESNNFLLKTTITY